MLYYCRIKCTKGNHLYFFVEMIAGEISISAIVVKILHLACYQMATRCFLGVLAANFSVLTISPRRELHAKFTEINRLFRITFISTPKYFYLRLNDDGVIWFVHENFVNKNLHFNLSPQIFITNAHSSIKALITPLNFFKIRYNIILRVTNWNFVTNT